MKFSHILVAVTLASSATALPVETGMDNQSKGIFKTMVDMVKRVTGSTETTSAESAPVVQIYTMSS